MPKTIITNILFTFTVMAKDRKEVYANKNSSKPEIKKRNTIENVRKSG